MYGISKRRKRLRRRNTQNRRFSDVFRGYRSGTLVEDGLMPSGNERCRAGRFKYL